MKTQISPTEINEDIKVETPTEYTGEKTEIFDFPDFSDIPGGEKIAKEKEINIDDEILETAKDYAASLMNK